MASISYFSTVAQDNFEYLLNENTRLWRELVAVRQQEKHIAVDQCLSTQIFNIAKWKSTM